MTENKKNIVLIGMMGAGKSTVGHLLYLKLEDFSYLDLDKEIEKTAQKSIPEIFEQDGESYFRELEHSLVQKFSNYHNQVISTGGGIVENSDNLKLLQKNSVTFYLSASIDNLFERVKKTTNRPLLKHTNPKERIKELLQKRESFYKKADFEIRTDDKELIEIVEEIIEKYETIT